MSISTTVGLHIYIYIERERVSLSFFSVHVHLNNANKKRRPIIILIDVIERPSKSEVMVVTAVDEPRYSKSHIIKYWFFFIGLSVSLIGTKIWEVVYGWTVELLPLANQTLEAGTLRKWSRIFFFCYRYYLRNWGQLMQCEIDFL